MRSATRAVFGAAMLAMAQGQGVVLSATGDSGTSLGLQGESILQNDIVVLGLAFTYTHNSSAGQCRRCKLHLGS